MGISSPIFIGVVGGLGFGFLAFSSRRRLSKAWLRLLSVGVFGLFTVLSIVAAVWGVWVVSGDGSTEERELSSNVSYERLSVTGDDVAHLVTIDLSDPCSQLITTDVAFDGDVKALRTESWAEQESAIVAMNASFFAPFNHKKPWGVYPEEGDEVRILGFAVVDGDPRGMPRNWQGMWPGENVFLDGDGKPGIAFDFPSDATWAVTGRERILVDGKVATGDAEPDARSVIGVNAKKNTMWWLVVDGKQPGYSRGVSLADAARFLNDRGATDALEMDDGGSSILVGRSKGETSVLSRPISQYLPGRSRVVANHVGVVDGCSSG